MSVFNFLNFLLRSLRRRSRKYQTIPDDRSCVVIPPSISAPASLERVIYYRKVWAVQRRRGLIRRDLHDAMIANQAATTSASTGRTQGAAIAASMGDARYKLRIDAKPGEIIRACKHLVPLGQRCWDCEGEFHHG